jgi:hypothetical protein
VTAILQRLRPLLIGVVVLLLTAGIAFASKPSAPASGPATGTEASGKTVPVVDDQKDASEDAADVDDATETVEAAEDAETDAEASENCATDPTGLTGDALAQLSHGSIVCWAASQDTPEGYANHGAWVSEWAKKNHGHADEAIEDATTAAPVAAPTGSEHGKSGKGSSAKP